MHDKILPILTIYLRCSLRLWLFSHLSLVKVLGHSLHLILILLWTVLLWYLRSSTLLNAASQCSHLWFLMAQCTDLTCLVTALFEENFLSHSLHLNSSSAVLSEWMAQCTDLTCLVTALVEEKAFSHSLQSIFSTVIL